MPMFKNFSRAIVLTAAAVSVTATSAASADDGMLPSLAELQLAFASAEDSGAHGFPASVPIPQRAVAPTNLMAGATVDNGFAAPMDGGARVQQAFDRAMQAIAAKTRTAALGE